MTAPGQPIETLYVAIMPDFTEFSSALRRQLDRVLDRLERDAADAFGDIERSAADAGRSISISITIGAQRAEAAIDDLADSAVRDFGRIERKAATTGAMMSGEIGGALTGIGRVLTGVATQMVSSLSQLALILTAVVALLPSVVALAAALADLIGLVAALPAALGVVLAAILPLVVAFQNFGDAIGAVMDGDPEKIAEALKKLAPAAQGVVREFQRLLPAFRDFQKLTQESLFRPLQGVLTQVATALLPSLRVGFSQVATELGRMIAQFGALLAQPDTIQVFAETFAATARIIATLGPSLVKVFDAIFSSIHEALPFVERLAGAFGRALEGFANFLNKAIETGEFDAFLEEAIATLKELFALGKAVGSLIGTIFGATDEAGRGLIGTLTDVVQRLDEFFKSAEGQEAIKNTLFTVKALGAAIGDLVNIFIFVNKANNEFIHGLAAMAKGIKAALDAIGDFFGEVGDFLSSVPAKVGQFLESIPSIIAGVFQQSIDQVLIILGIGIGTIMSLISEVPVQIGQFLSTIPQRAEEALTELGPRLLAALGTAFEMAKTFLMGQLEEIKAAIFGVPDQVEQVGPRLLQAGRNLIQSFMNGFRAANDFIANVAGDIVGALKGGLNRAIDKINQGIAAVDDVLPGSLPRIPRLAKGGIIPATQGGQLFVAGEAGQAEAVIPLPQLENMGSNVVVNMVAGAIQVMFNGAVPTAAEAYEAGRQVFAGWQDALAARDDRVSARAA